MSPHPPPPPPIGTMILTFPPDSIDLSFNNKKNNENNNNNDVIINIPPSSPSRSLRSSFFQSSCPSELLSLISSYLDPRSLHFYSSSSHFSSIIANNHHLWNNLYFNQFHSYPSSSLHSKREYIVRQNEISRKLIEAKRIEKQRRKDKTRIKGEFPVHICIEPCFFFITMALLVLLTILVVVELSSTGTVSVYSMWPIAAFVAYIVFILILSLYTRYCSNPFPFSSTFKDRTKNFFAMLLHEVEYDSRPFAAPFITFIVFSSFLLSILFIFLQLSGFINWNWAYILLPMFFTVFVFCCFPCLTPHFKDGLLFCGLSMILLVPFVLFLILLVIRIEGVSDLKVAYVFIPLFFIDFLSILVAIALTIKDGCLWTAAWFFGYSPFFIFKILVCVRYDTSYVISWSEMLVPLFYIELIGLVGGCVLGLCSYSDRKHRYHPNHLSLN